ncbi:GspH/FimT family pseudopilin [Amphritea balenae]|nr:GspH/FimT family pseudopilin [Amphritea balenae]GGK83495.1 hypothetical protein GCM10007941_37540 [Amphritea balenae]
MQIVGIADSMLKPQRGFTLIELLVTLAIVAVLLAIAVPNMSSYWKGARLVSATEAIYTQMQLARSVSLARNQTISIDFAEGGSWCMAISEDALCNCVTGAQCTLTGMPQAMLQASDFPDISITTSFTSEETSFLYPRGNVSDAGEVTLTSVTGDDAKVSMTVLGRIEICSDDLDQYPGC